MTKDKWVWDIHRASSWLRSYSSSIPSDETVQRTLQSQLLTTFSLGMVRDWVNSAEQIRLADQSPKVRGHATLGHFLYGLPSSAKALENSNDT